MSERVVNTSREASYAVITPEMIAKERERIGQILRRPQPFIELTSRDAIRHWAQGIGDRNPLWLDESYARTTAWGDIIAPPTIAMALTTILPSGFRGVHGWHMGVSTEWNEPIRRDQTFYAVDTLESIDEVDSQYVKGKTWDQVIKSDIINRATGQVACVNRTFIRRFERDRGREAAKESRERTRYTGEEIDSLARETLSESAQGARLLRPSDIQVGDDIGSILRGPLTSTDCVAFVRGWGGAYILAHGDMWDFASKHPGAFPPDSSGVPDSPERTHWSDEFARSVGAPTAFDYGPQRTAWCGTLVTNWAGDDAVMRRLSVKLRRPNYHGDTVRIGGAVTKVDTRNRSVEVEITGANQLGDVVVQAEAQVELEYTSRS
jgi:acyl dehydratase